MAIRENIVSSALYDMRIVAHQGSHIVRGLTPPPVSINTAGNVTYNATQILGGVIVRDCAGAARSDSLPTAASIVAGMFRGFSTDMLRCLIVNGSAGANDAQQITLLVGAGGAFDANQQAASQIIRSGCSKEIAIRLTNVVAGSEAYVVYV